MKRLIVAMCAALFGAWSCAPYSVDDFKMLKAATLRDQIKEWHIRQRPGGFGYTNDTDKCWLVSTNIVADGHRVDGIIVLESSLFQRHGCLIGTDTGEVYWYDGKTAHAVQRQK